MALCKGQHLGVAKASTNLRHGRQLQHDVHQRVHLQRSRHRVVEVQDAGIGGGAVAAVETRHLAPLVPRAQVFERGYRGVDVVLDLVAAHALRRKERRD